MSDDNPSVQGAWDLNFMGQPPPKPKSNWTVVVPAMFTHANVPVDELPNAFHRLMQRLVLGFVWTQAPPGKKP